MAADGYWSSSPAGIYNPGEIAITPDGTRLVDVTDLPGAESTLEVRTTATAGLASVGLQRKGANGLAISPGGTEAYTALMGDETTTGGVTVVNLVTHAVTATLNEGNVYDVAYTPDGSKVYAVVPRFGSPTGQVKVIGTATRNDLATITVGAAPMSVAFSPDGARAYVTNSSVGSSAGSVSVIDVATSNVIATIPVGQQPGGVAVTPNGDSVIVANFGNGSAAGTVSVISTATNTVTTTIANVGVGPNGVQVTPDGSQTWVLNVVTGNIAVIDLATKTKVHTYWANYSQGGRPKSIVFSPDGLRAWVTVDLYPSSGLLVTFDVKAALWTPSVSRISGADRYATAVAVSQKAFPAAAPVVFVATGTRYPDALAAAAPAAKLGGPLLLTDPDSLPTIVEREIQRLHPSTIYIVGGTGAVSTAVEQELAPLAPTITRLAGIDRYATARAVIAAAFPTFTSVYVATGLNFPDALSASAAGGGTVPVLLVNGVADSLDSATSTFLTGAGANSFTLVGGPTIVTNGIATQLATLGTVNRIYGADRTATSQLINAAAFPTVTSAYFATGTEFADALSGAVLAAVNHAPLYTVATTCVPIATVNDLVGHGTGAVTLIGGTGALSNSIVSMHNC
jgi:YVTN family beta-propeller protein